MTATLTQSQAELPRLVELASRGEDIVITVEGKPKAVLTHAQPSPYDAASPTPVNLVAWMKELEDLRQKFATGKSAPSTEEILSESRS